MSNVPPPLLGFNNNVRHRGRVFHIQTEDSGIRNPRIVTHLFADGGRIIKTTRTDYTAQLGRADIAVVVRNMMKEQHKAMFTALRAGDLDPLLEGICADSDGSAPVLKPDLPPMSAPVPVAPAALGKPPPLPHRAPNAQRSASSAQRPLVQPATAEAAVAAQRQASNDTIRKVTPQPITTSQDPIELEHVAAAALQTPVTGRAARSGSSSSGRKRQGSNPPAVTAAASASRPASRFAAAPPKTSHSIFGDTGVSEQSLDEVILSYLAEDLDTPSE